MTTLSEGTLRLHRVNENKEGERGSEGCPRVISSPNQRYSEHCLCVCVCLHVCLKKHLVREFPECNEVEGPG